ncbi:hypothetical protein SBV1_2270002 [Verrucomicrobia bacterium]|nr:hypothetical protein SBV1_2270002 [Verrucomicrobiota bacterium]
MQAPDVTIFFLTLVEYCVTFAPTLKMNQTCPLFKSTL